MGKLYQELTPGITAWIRKQHMFFVATAPSSEEGHLNCSPKGLDTLQILGPQTVAYLDLTGSGAETIAHVRENARIVFMFCAFSGPPKIVRLHGRADIVLPSAPDWAELRSLFPPHPGTRAIIRAKLTRISDSCGYGVPVYEYKEERKSLPRWARTKGVEGIQEYQREVNQFSIDGLPALD